MDRNILSDLMALRFYFAAPNLQTVFLCLTSEALVNLWRDFLVLDFFIVTNGPDDIGLLSVILLGVENIDASIIALY